MLSEESKDSIRTLYRQCIDSLSLKRRPGQGVMIAKIANAIGMVQEGKHGERINDAGIVVVEAGTGTGKTLAYLVATLPLALQLNKKLWFQRLLLLCKSKLLIKTYLAYSRPVISIFSTH